MLKLRLFFIILSVCLGISLLLVQGCKKDNAAPVIELLNPFNGQDISTTDSILISGTLSDDVDLHELDIIVTNLNGDTVYYNSPYVHGLKTHKFNVLFAPQDTGTYVVTATIYDHDLAATSTSSIVYAHNAARLNITQPLTNGDTTGLQIENVQVFKNDSLYVAGNVNDNKGLLYITFTGINARTGDTATTKSILLNNATNYNISTYLSQPDTGIFNLNIAVVNHYSFVTRKSIRYVVR